MFVAQSIIILVNLSITENQYVLFISSQVETKSQIAKKKFKKPISIMIDATLSSYIFFKIKTNPEISSFAEKSD